MFLLNGNYSFDALLEVVKQNKKSENVLQQPAAPCTLKSNFSGRDVVLEDSPCICIHDFVSTPDASSSFYDLREGIHASTDKASSALHDLCKIIEGMEAKPSSSR